MASKKAENMTMEEYLLSQLDKVALSKDKKTITDPVDGHELTKQELIATSILNQAMKGDIKAAQYISSLQLKAQITKKK